MNQDRVPKIAFFMGSAQPQFIENLGRVAHYILYTWCFYMVILKCFNNILQSKRFFVTSSTRLS